MMTMTTAERLPTTTGRIPLSLQQVFVASSQGKQVDAPPADQTAFCIYHHRHPIHCSNKATAPLPLVLSKFTSIPAFQKSLCSVS